MILVDKISRNHIFINVGTIHRTHDNSLLHYVTYSTGIEKINVSIRHQVLLYLSDKRWSCVSHPLDLCVGVEAPTGLESRDREEFF